MPPIDELLAPIPGDNPCGEDLRYQPVYDQIKEARREEDDLAQGVWQRARKVADWAQVVKLASGALAKKSKDLQLAAWYAEALVHREGFSGFLQGLALNRGLIEAYWDHLYPELEDGDSEFRAVPLSYLASRLDATLRQVPLTAAGVTWNEYRDSLTIPSEEETTSDSKKKQARAAAVNDGKMTPEDVDSALKQTPADFFAQLGEELSAAREELEQIDAICNDKFGEYAPNFAALKECIEQIENTVRILTQRKGATAGKSAVRPASSSDPFGEAPAPAPPPAPAAASAADAFGDTPVPAAPADDPFADPFGDAPPAPAQDPFAAPAPARDPFAAAAPAPAARLTAEPSSHDDAVQRIASSALWLRKNAPTSPAPYLLLRALRWGELRASGQDPDWSLLEAAPLEVRQKLKRLSQEGNWEELLAACEEAMALPCGRAWLDLQRYTLQALAQLGDEYKSVRDVVRRELRDLLNDFPALPSLTLNDDTPAANAQTIAFLRDEGLLGADVPAPRAEPSAPSDDDLIRDALRARKHELALAIVARLMKQEASGRARFERKIQQARILMEAGRKIVAYPILRELAAEIFDRRLDEWEPSALVVEPLMLLYQCLEKGGNDAAERQRIYELICRLDPVRAFELH